MYASNEELLREGECGHSNCIEDAGHKGPHSFELFPPMTTCEGLTEDERAMLTLREAGGRVGMSRAIAYLAERLADSRAREGELVAALAFYADGGNYPAIWRRHSGAAGQSAAPVAADCGARARAVLGECPTCQGTRVAPGDSDLGGKGVTNSPCPECVSPALGEKGESESP